MRSTGRNHKNLGRYLVIIILSKFRLRSTYIIEIRLILELPAQSARIQALQRSLLR